MTRTTMSFQKVKISTLNLCLGLKNKKLEINQLLNHHDMDVMCLQETEIEKHFNPELLAINGYELEIETNNVKARTGMFT